MIDADSELVRWFISLVCNKMKWGEKNRRHILIALNDETLIKLERQ